MNTPIKVACVGAGFFSKFHREAWHRITQVDLCGIYDRECNRIEHSDVPMFDSLSQLLDVCNPDVLDIITPPPTHASIVRQAIAHGTTLVICQKPFCETLEQARALVVEAEQSNTTLVVHENFRFQPWFRLIKEQLDAGTLGTVQQAVFRLRTGDGQGPDAYLSRQPYFQTMPRFLIHETGVHYLDTFRYLFGDPIAVYADLRKLNEVIAGEDSAFVLFDFPGQLRALFDGNRHLDFVADDTRLTFGDFIVEGSKATIYLYGDGRVTRREFGAHQEQVLLAARQWSGFSGDCVHALHKHVVDHLLYDTPLENTAAQYLSVLALEHRVYESAEKGCKLYLQ